MKSSLDLRRHTALLLHPGIHSEMSADAYPPWGLLCIGEVLRRRGADVYVEDLNGADLARVVPQLLAEHRPTVVGITGKMGLAAERLRQVIDAIRRHRPDLPIGVGGPLVASFPEPHLPLWRGIDMLFRGDGEESFAEWVAGGCRARGITAPAEAADLDSVGIPCWWEPLRRYVQPADQWPQMEVPSIHVAASRGCTRRCTFCYLNTHYPGSRFRFVSAPRLVDGFRQLRERFGADGFYFVDDCFIDRPPRRVVELCDLLERLGSPFRIGCDVQISDLEEVELLARMHRAGFRCLYVGVEAASAEVRKRLGKAQVHESLAKLLGRTIDLGFLVYASIGMGWPGETEAAVEETLALIDREPRLVFDAFRYMPLPGAPLTRYWSRRNGKPQLGSSEHVARQDYCEFNANYSEIADDRFEALWRQMLRRRDERYDMRFGPVEEKSGRAEAIS